MYTYPTCLTIAGSDSSGGAGIQADLKTISAIGVYGMSAITAITAQNTCGVIAVQPIDKSIVQLQIEAVMDDIGADSIKIGMIHSPEIAMTIIEMLDKYSPKYTVLDPVMISTSGHSLVKEDTISIIKELFPSRVTLVTPNVDEAEILADCSIDNERELTKAGEKLLAMGWNAVLMKGGHLKSNVMNDIFFSQNEDPLILSADYIPTRNSHGTGCTLSSAIAANLALNIEIKQAIINAKEYITQALKAGADIRLGKGHGPLNHFFNPKELNNKQISK